MEKIKKIGIVTAFRLDEGGGAPRVTIDLINTLNSFGKKVYLLTPFKIDYQKIKDFYGQVKIEKVYSLSRLKSFFCKGRALPRKIFKKKFQQIVKKVDLIIDIDGGIAHNYLPENFDRNRYIIWRISCVKPASERVWEKSFKGKTKEIIKNFLGESKCIPSKMHKIYPVDKWTSKELKKYWKLNSEKKCLYPEIKVNEFLKNKLKKKNQIIIFGRIAPNKSIDMSMEIFAHGTKKYSEYKLIILGGTTAETSEYLQKLKKLAEKLNISSKIQIIKNPSFEKLKKILKESKVIIDSQKGVSLTMTSIEAMAAGCIVLGYKNSGGYIDILDNGAFGYGFLNIKEGGKKLSKILDGLKKKKINNKKSIKRAQAFSNKRFIKTLNQILNIK